MDDMRLKARVAKLSSGVMQKNAELEREAAELRDRLELFEKRAFIEDILINAQGSTVTKLKAATVEDFLSKRAELEGQAQERLEKLSMLVEYSEDEEGIFLADEDDSSGGDFTDYLRTIS